MSLVIDSHTHVWSDKCPLTPERRYTPAYSRSSEDLLAQMKVAGVNRAVLVQPSFLGTDNRYLLQQLGCYPEIFRGVVVVDRHIQEADFAPMVAKGVTGVRLNIIGSTVSGRQLVQEHQHLIQLLNKFDCHLEIQSHNDHWVELLPALMQTGVTVVVDHFGRPDSNRSAGFQAVLNHLNSGKLWVKLSGEYRFAAAPIPLATALLNHRPDRLVWGSDYPWTQHEAGRRYQDCFTQLAQWTSHQYLEAIRADNPARLFKFDTEGLTSF
ncbi:amidohydrolase family protein [Vibrio rhizosphaerae]|uniref:Amidohydrolase family protein n=1 Tax=Vibrio rhizosphaerae TaxID=398736 RepID=A0ABU4IVU2_9VIBR|nr:amidohydrolase family protein [Vibrio rhizosphaerae]MDW6093541.1 amidohydrolase family protein [Vibrio rhizosphaerae]